ncbi:hypothetical protein ACQZV8_13795 [Magnetococcales bacterium HHB-1]
MNSIQQYRLNLDLSVKIKSWRDFMSSCKVLWSKTQQSVEHAPEIAAKPPSLLLDENKKDRLE